MKRILYSMLVATVVFLGNYFFSNGTLAISVETPTPVVAMATAAPTTVAPATLAVPTAEAVYGKPVPADISSALIEGSNISYSGSSFTISAGLADGAQASTVPQFDDFSWWPAHTKYVLKNYPLQGKTYEPQILIFPAREYAQMKEYADAYGQTGQPAPIESLQTILNTQNFSTLETLPLLPYQHATQVIHAQGKILSFQNGSGIRYITQYSQAAFPLINNTDIFYTFQGLTIDGEYYVSVIMPVNLPYLAADYGPNAFSNPTEWQNAEKFPEYLRMTVDRLNQAEGEAKNPYAPSLAALDALVQSLLVEKSAASGLVPPTVEPAAPVSKTGVWITNLGKLTLNQSGPEITGSMDGYGELKRQDSLQGTSNGDSAVLNSQLLGDLNLVFSGNTFKTTPGSRVAFCGIRASESSELPSGCGFSGMWLLSPNNFFPGDSKVVMKQVAGNVTAEFFDGKGNSFDILTGQIYWGKGWGVSGKNKTGHNVTLVMNSFETGFEYIYDDLFQLKLCAVREGLKSADLGNFSCNL